jgi:hypothetical protein
MHTLTMFGAREVAPDTICLSSYFPLPGLGTLPVNAFVIRAAEPLPAPDCDALEQLKALGAAA